MFWKSHSDVQSAREKFCLFLIVLRCSNEVILKDNMSSNFAASNFGIIQAISRLYLKSTGLAKVPVSLPMVVELAGVFFRQVVNELGEGDIVAELFRFVARVGSVFCHNFCTVTALELIRERVL